MAPEPAGGGLGAHAGRSAPHGTPTAVRRSTLSRPPTAWLPASFTHPIVRRGRARPPPAPDPRRGRRPRHGGRDGLARAAVEHLRRRVGVAAGRDDPRAGPRGPGPPRRRDGDPRVLQLRPARHRRDGAARLRLHRPAGSRARGARTRRSRGGSSTSASAPTSRPRSTTWCPGGSPRRGPCERPRYVGRDLSWAAGRRCPTWRADVSGPSQRALSRDTGSRHTLGDMSTVPPPRRPRTRRRTRT